jgi:hypothetical protein
MVIFHPSGSPGHNPAGLNIDWAEPDDFCQQFGQQGQFVVKD